MDMSLESENLEALKNGELFRDGLNYKIGLHGGVYYWNGTEWLRSTRSVLEVTSDSKFGPLGQKVLSFCRDWSRPKAISEYTGSSAYQVKKTAERLVSMGLLERRLFGGCKYVEYKQL